VTSAIVCDEQIRANVFLFTVLNIFFILPRLTFFNVFGAFFYIWQVM